MRQHWEVDELVEHWTLDDQDVRLLRNKTGATRLGFAVLLKFFEHQGRFPAGPDEVAIEVVDFIAGQLGLSFTRAGRLRLVRSLVESPPSADPIALRVSGIDRGRRRGPDRLAGRGSLVSGSPPGTGRSGAGGTLPGRAGGTALARAHHPDSELLGPTLRRPPRDHDARSALERDP
jgi:Domain of unknown function (DUF4158)